MTYTEYLDSKTLKVCYNKFDELSTDVSDENIYEQAPPNFARQEYRAKYPVVVSEPRVRYPSVTTHDPRSRFPPVSTQDSRMRYPPAIPQDTRTKYPVVTQD